MVLENNRRGLEGRAYKVWVDRTSHMESGKEEEEEPLCSRC
jgi:hypothetical protein